MKIRVSELQVGQAIRFEYGIYDNFVTGQVDSVKEAGQFMEMGLNIHGKSRNVRFFKSELVEVSC